MAGPGTSVYLGDLGADVIKIEPHKGGDGSRALSTNGYLKENSRMFMAFNRNKRSVALDIHKPEGKKVLLELITRSDVLITNMRPSVVGRLGLGYPTLRELNPRLIYAQISGYGNEGPYAESPAYDRMTQGLAGAMLTRDAEGVPQTAGVWISDCSIPMMLSYGIMAALWTRERTGVGQKVETSLLHAAIAMQAEAMVRVENDPTPLAGHEIASYGIFRCSDDRFINVGALMAHHFRRLCDVVDLPHLADDPRFTDPDRQAEFNAEVFPVLAAIIATRPLKEWQALLMKADIPCAPVLPRSEVFDEPQMVINKMFAQVRHPKAGPITLWTQPLHLSETPPGVRMPPPLLGQHTEEVLKELGYKAKQIVDLRAKEVIL